MKISELIIELEKIKKEHGDIICVIRDYDENCDATDSDPEPHFCSRVETKGPNSESEPGVIL